jgi:hypothetical protein
MIELKPSGVYIMQANNGLVKIGKANNAEIRRQQLEQGVNMFNQGEKLKIKVVAFYPFVSDVIAFALESHLHEVFATYDAGTTSREIFCIDVVDVVRVADTWVHAWSVAQTVMLAEHLFTRPTTVPK